MRTPRLGSGRVQVSSESSHFLSSCPFASLSTPVVVGKRGEGTDDGADGVAGEDGPADVFLLLALLGHELVPHGGLPFAAVVLVARGCAD